MITEANRNTANRLVEHVRRTASRENEEHAMKNAVAQALADEREKCAVIAANHRPWKFKRNGPEPHYTGCKGCGEFIASEIRGTAKNDQLNTQRKA